MSATEILALDATDPAAMSGFAHRRKDDVFGHPRGLAYLVFAESWERFSFNGMQALLVLYMGLFFYQATWSMWLGSRPFDRLCSP